MKNIVIIILLTLFANNIWASEIPKKILNCYIHNYQTGEYEDLIVTVDNTLSRPQATPNGEIILKYLRRMSELNMGFPNGDELNVDAEPPLGCIRSQSHILGRNIKCPLGHDSGYDFSFVVYEAKNQHGESYITGSFQHSSPGIGGGPTMICY